MRKLDNKGNAAIMLCISITALLGFAAYVVDIGVVYAEKTKLSNALDSAALAATLELTKGDDKAKAVANDYLQKNGVDPRDTVSAISSDHKTIEIRGTRNVNHLFAQVLGIKSSSVKANTKAIIAPIKAINSGIRPLAVEIYDFSYGDLVTLKEGAGDGYRGNYKAVALGGQGASTFTSNALYGYKGKITVGDYINTEPGNMSGATSTIAKYINSESSSFNNFSRDSIRLWVIPLVDSLVVNGLEQVKVSGFGMFYVEYVFNKSGQTDISGRFVRFVTNGEIDTSLRDTGAYGVKLSK
jgi:Flp pilus assembly protein TadG